MRAIEKAPVELSSERYLTDRFPIQMIQINDFYLAICYEVIQLTFSFALKFTNKKLISIEAIRVIAFKCNCKDFYKNKTTIRDEGKSEEQ